MSRPTVACVLLWLSAPTVVEAQQWPAAAVPVAPTSDAYPHVSRQGRIVFQSNRLGGSRLFVLDSVGAEPRLVVTGGRSEVTPVWSPDGRRILFVSTRDDNEDVYVINADGSGERRVTDHPGSDSHPSWSPDGSRIVFCSTRGDGENDDIYVMQGDGSGVRRLTDNGLTWDTFPSFSPDGSRILFRQMHRVRLEHGITAINSEIMVADGRMTSREDTWEWDRRRWLRVASSGGPGLRDHHAMTYDPVRKHAILFGGFRGIDSVLNDTWAWNGRAWSRLAIARPPGRGTHRLVFDEGRGVMVLFGGYGANNVPLNDTWEWDGQRWRQVTTSTAPSPRGDARMAYDPRRQRIVLFGGQSGNANTGDTWEYDGRDWSRVDVAGPSPRNAHEMAYDPRAKAVLLFGGRDELLLDGGAGRRRYNDLWMFNGTWRQIVQPETQQPHATKSAESRSFAGASHCALPTRPGIGISIGAGRLSVEYRARSPTARAPSGGQAACEPTRSRASRTVGSAVTVGERCRRGPICRAGGTAAHAEGPRVVRSVGAVFR